MSSSPTRQENEEDGELSDDNLSNISSDEDVEEITTQIKTNQVVLSLDKFNKVITTSVPFKCNLTVKLYLMKINMFQIITRLIKMAMKLIL